MCHLPILNVLQAMKSKSLILETNNQMLDNGTKEEVN